MKKNFQTNNDEIDLINLMQTIWKGKWKIAVAVVVSYIAMIIYQPTPKNNFTAITKIKPISYLEINKYLVFNNLIDVAKTNTKTNVDVRINTNTVNASKITSLRLLNLYLDILNEKSVFEDAIRKFNLLDASQYNNDQKYSEAIIRLASSVKILSPSVSNKSITANLETPYSTISFTHHDAEKWKSVLTYADELANKLVKNILIEQYNNTLLYLRNERKYQLEDITTKIDNHLVDYERKISDRVAYLKEQSQIARELGIPRNTIEVQTFSNQNPFLSNVPYYLRGYEAIDKEIELINSRKDKKAFIEELFQLEKKKRSIEQNQTIERIRLALQLDLLSENKEFSAASIKAITTQFKYDSNDNRKMLVLAIVIGLMAGIFYVIISNAFQSQRVSRKKTN